jgi:peptide/nickel transport system substrate-binding protein
MPAPQGIGRAPRMWEDDDERVRAAGERRTGRWVMYGLKGGIVNQHVRLRPVLLLLLAAAVCVVGLVRVMDARGASSASPASSAAASSAAGGGNVVYRVGWTREPDNLNPFVGYAAPSFEIWYLTYDSLVGYDPSTLEPMKGEKSTGLATDWSVSPDGLTWTFQIRHNAKWSDGVPLTAKDVAFTYNYIIKNNMETLTAYTRLIKEAVAVDDYTVKMICSKPKPDMIRSWVPILPEHIWSKVDPKQAADGKYTNNPPYVGSGPFKAMEWKKTQDVYLVRNPTWWGPKPKIDAIYFLAYTNSDTLLQDLRAGTVDAAVDLTTTQMKQLASEPGITARAVKIDGFNDIGFNCYNGPSHGNPVLRDWKFRNALNWAIDRQKIVSLVWGNTTTPGTTIIPPDYYKNPDWHWQPPADQLYTYNPEKARQLLDAAGYKDTNGDGIREDKKGKPITLTLIARDESAPSQMTGKLVVGWLNAVGVKTKLEVMDEATLGDRELNYDKGVFTPDFDMFLWGWYLDYDPGSMLSYLTTNQIENWNETCFSDPEYDKLYVQQSEELDPAKRKVIIDRMQQILYEKTPYMVTDYSPDYEAYNTAKWDGYIHIPSPDGNAILPPFGNGGYANFLSIGPKVAGSTATGGSSTGTYVAIAVVVVVVVLIVVWLVLRRRTRETEEL